MAFSTKYLGLLVLTLVLGLTVGSPGVEPLTDQRQGHLKDLPNNIRRNLERRYVAKDSPAKSQWEKTMLEMHDDYQDEPRINGCIEEANNTKATCYGINVTEIPQNLSMTIESIEFDSTGIEIISDGIFRNYTELSSIYFHSNLHLREISSGAFKGLSNLTFLLLPENGLTDISFGNETYEGLSSLEVLILGGNELKRLPKYLLAGATNVNLLWLYRTAIDQMGLELIYPLDKLGHLDLSDTQFSSLEPSIFYQMANLRYLNLNYNNITIIKSGALKELEKLVQFDCTASFGPDLATLTVQDDAFPRNLRFLDLSRHRQMNLSIMALVNAPALEEISLNVCDFNYLDRAPFMYNPNLKKLDISGNYFACDCRASWMAEAIVESKPWALDWGKNGTTSSPDCDSPSWMRYMDISKLYPQDLTCDKPYIEAITPTFIHRNWDTEIVFQARMRKGYPQASWVLPDGSVIKERRQAGWVNDRVVEEDHSVITRCGIYKDFNITGLVNFTLVASNVAGESNLTFWVFAEPPPPPSSAVQGPSVSTVSILLLLLMSVVHHVVL